MSGPVPDLLPCPFCGAQDAHFQSEYDDESVFVCAICDARGPMKRSHAEAIAAWNTRTTDAEQAKIAALVAERNALRARVEVLEDDLLKASRPVWFYHPDHTEVCQWSPHEVVDDYYDPEPGEHVFEVECARPLPSIWCAVRVTDDEDADERFTLTEHASEDEARAALALAKGEAA